jgi:hypothetical protein
MAKSENLMSQRIWSVVVFLSLPVLFVTLQVANVEVKASGASSPQPCILLYTNDTQGLLHPCSCRDGVLGGLPRRAALLKSLAKNDSPLLLLDSGNLLASDSDAERIPVVVKSYALMGYQAVNMGQWDLRLQRTLTQETQRAGVLLLCDSEGITSRVLTVGSFQVGVIGLTPTAWSEGNKTNVATVVQQRIMELKAQCRLVIVLSQLGKIGDEKIVERVTGINVLIGNADWATLKSPLRIKNMFILPTSIKGQHLGRVELEVDDTGKVEVLKHQLIPLTPDIANDGDIYKLLQDYYRDLAKRLATSKPVSPDSFLPPPSYMNSQACAICHEKEFSLWSKSGHAHALKTLHQKGEELNPDCLTCHSEHYRRTRIPPLSTLVRGDERKKEFDPSLSVQLSEGVECSTCHGDGLEHSLRPHTRGLITTAPDEKVCRQCHTSTQTPHFDYNKFMEKIKH